MKPSARRASRSKRPDLLRSVLICFLLAVATFIVYARVASCGFVFDDDAYVVNNQQLQGGLSRASVAWAFTSGYAGNWHPLTWLSHMVDYELHGLAAAGHHVTNLLVHLASTLLLFLVLQQMTGATWRSTAVAGLFALHPLRVESVAWVSERKDVLNAFFWVLTMGAYVWYLRRPGFIRYLTALVSFALGLMTKQMLVTLPFVLLLLDYWPLGRFSLGRVSTHGDRQRRTSRDGWGGSPLPLSGLVVEKIPFFLLTLAGAIATAIAQSRGGAIASLETIPFGMRLQNALLSYAAYIGKTFWPVNLSVFYPYRNAISWAQAGGALLLLIGVSVWVIRSLRGRPYLAVGWFWYLGALVPVIGLVQIGEQSMADRYSYIPSIGLFVLVCWYLHDLARRSRAAPTLLAASAMIVMIGLAVVTHRQVGYWRSGLTLFEHALRVTTDNYLAHDNLGWALTTQGRIEEAASHFREAVRIKPDYAIAHSNLGRAALDLGRIEEAVEHHLRAVEIDPDESGFRLNLAISLASAGRLDEAASQFSEAMRLNPESPHSEGGLARLLTNLGTTMVGQQRFDAAAALLTRAVELSPEMPDAHVSLAHAFLARGMVDDALRHYRRAVELNPGADDEYLGYGKHLAPQAHFGYGHTLAARGRPADAVREYREALRLSPGLPAATAALAWILATTENDSLRNADEAMALATDACRATGNRDPKALDALAAACAEKGQFADAVRHAGLAIEAARAVRRDRLAQSIEERAEGYRHERRFRQQAVDLGE